MLKIGYTIGDKVEPLCNIIWAIIQIAFWGCVGLGILSIPVASIKYLFFG